MDGTNVHPESSEGVHSDAPFHILPDPTPGQIWLVSGPGLATNLLLDLGARLACQGPVRFLDGGNRFNAYLFDRLAARWLTDRACELNTPPSDRPNLISVLKRTRLARAFTCYQVLTLLAETPVIEAPTLVLDLLSTFYDENVPLPEALRLLGTCIGHLRRLSILAPVVVSVKIKSNLRTALGPLQEDRAALLDLLEAAAGKVWTFEPAAAANPQTDFFGRI